MSEINTNNMLPVGIVLRGTYRIDRYLSNGILSNTYVATNVQFHELVIIKEFFMKGVTHRDGKHSAVSVSNSEHRTSFEEQREKFKKEAKLLRQLHSDHIVTVHDLFDENGTAYYVMDYIDGESLGSMLKRTGALPEDKALDIMRQVLDALEVVHNADVNQDGKKGILHLDIKPANIMLDRQGKVKLIDFGASKQISNSGGATTSTAIRYTEGYAPREQMEQNLDKFGPETDIYALGATLYTLLTGMKPPLPSDIDGDTSIDKHASLPMPVGISDKTRQIVLWMMKTNMVQRPSSVAEVKKFMNGIYTRNNSNLRKGFAAMLLGLVIGVGGYLYKQYRIANNPEIQYQLGVKYFNGDGVPSDSVTAFEYFTKAAELGYVSAQDTLGRYYYNGDFYEQNFTTAITWFRKAAEQGDAYAQNALGECYLSGKGVDKDFISAVQWFKKAAVQGNIDALLALGYCYKEGLGVGMDYIAAVEWFRKAAEGGNVYAQYYLAQSYENGQGVQKDISLAKDWYIKSAAQGYKKANKALTDLILKNEGVRK